MNESFFWKKITFIDEEIQQTCYNVFEVIIDEKY